MPGYGDTISKTNDRGFIVGFVGDDRERAVMGPSFVLGGSSEASVTVTGTTAETTIGALTIPAGMVEPGASLRLTAIYTMTGTGGTRTLRAKFAGADIFGGQAVAAGASQSVAKVRDLFIRNGPSHVCYSSWAEWGVNTSPNSFPAIDFSQDVAVLLTVQLASAADTCKLEAWRLELFP